MQGKTAYPWLLTQERIDLLAAVLMKMEVLCDTAAPGCIAAERAACLLTDLRSQVVEAGAEDPYPDRALSPRFEEASTAASNQANRNDAAQEVR